MCLALPARILSTPTLRTRLTSLLSPSSSQSIRQCILAFTPTGWLRLWTYSRSSSSSSSRGGGLQDMGMWRNSSSRGVSSGHGYLKQQPGGGDLKQQQWLSSQRGASPASSVVIFTQGGSGWGCTSKAPSRGSCAEALCACKTTHLCLCVQPHSPCATASASGAAPLLALPQPR